MNRSQKIMTALALTGALGLAAIPASADPGRGWDRGPHGGPGMGMQYGGPMMAHGPRGGFFGMRGPATDRNLTADQVRTLAEARLIMRGNENLKVGEISETEDGSYLVEIVTQDDSLVQRVEISKATGFPVRKR